MTARREFELRPEQLRALQEASRPVPAMWGSGGQPLFSSREHERERLWQNIGEELGFDWRTAYPSPRGEAFILADPLGEGETDD